MLKISRNKTMQCCLLGLTSEYEFNFSKNSSDAKPSINAGSFSERGPGPDSP